MAEIAVAGAVALIEELIENVVPFLKKLNNRAARSNVEDVGILLKTLKAYLKDAERVELTESMKDQVERVRDLAFETEDAIEEFMVDVPEKFHHHTFTNIVHSVKDLIPISKLSSRIKAIKDKMNGIKDTVSLRIHPVEVASRSSAALVTPKPFCRNENLVGIEKRRAELIFLLFSEESKDLDVVISVFGDAGSGKTTLTYEVYELAKELFKCHAWVPVPRTRSTSEGLIEKICEAMELPVSQGTDRSRRLNSFLQEKRYVLVLDGISSEDEWNCIKNVLPSNNQGSRIIISTRKRNLASYCASASNYVYDLSPLTREEAWQLFCKKAFCGSSCPKKLVGWSEKIVERCEGLPHAIVAVGSLLSKKPQNEMEFKNFLHNLEFEPGSTPVGHSYISIFLGRYYNLSHNLKSCFLYFSNFPEDYSVKRGTLLRLWLAEGFVEKKGGKTREEVADEYLTELVQISLVHVSSWNFDGRVRSCRVSNLARDFILSKSEKDNFCTVFRRPNTSLVEKTRSLSLQICCPNLLENKDFSCVRTFFVFGGDSCSESMARKLFSNFKLLRVLDLENAALKCFPKEVVNLILLRYLSLRNTNIQSVPKSIKKLQNLVILDLRQTHVTKLPKKILELQKLVYLLVDSRDINHASVGAEVSSGIVGLTLLQKLSLIKANNNNKSIVKELGNLIELRKLGITELKKEDGKDLCASIEKMENLNSLYVKSASKEEYLDLNHVSKSPQLLNRLFLGGRLQEIPEWICSVHSLVKIELRWSKLEDNPLDALWTLPSLKELQMCDAYIGEVLEFGAEWFQELRALEIEQFSRLQMVVIHETAMPKLQKLIIRNCDKLNMVQGIHYLNHLEERLIIK